MVSVIIPVYNGERYVKKCIESVLCQSYDDFEIIVVDDGSADKSYSICCSLAEKDARIKLYKRQNQGVSAARNFGLEVAQGEYITFLDADDYIGKNHLSNLVGEIESKEVDMAVSGLVRNNEDGSNCIESTYPSQIITGKDASVSALMNYFDGGIDGFAWGKLFKKDLIGNLRFDPDIRQSEDTLFVMRYILKCNHIGINSARTYHYIRNSSSCMSEQSMSERKYTKYSAFQRIEECLSSDAEKYNLARKMCQAKQLNTLLSYVYLTKRSNLSVEEKDKWYLLIREDVKKHSDSSVMFLNHKYMNTKEKMLFLLYKKSPALFFRLVK